MKRFIKGPLWHSRERGARRRPRSRGARRLRRLALVLLLLLVGLPLTLTLLYAVVPPPATPLMLLRLAEGEGWTRDWTPLEDIAPDLGRAVIASEDNRFCGHFGFDLEAMGDALEEFQAGERLRGASTISMQTAKKLYLWPGRSFLRKALEAYLTIYLEVLLSKRRILELYLNIAEWGPGLYGAEAAARAYFRKPAAALTEREARLLAAVLPNPRRWNPARPSAYIAGRAAELRLRMDQLGPMLNCALP